MYPLTLTAFIMGLKQNVPIALGCGQLSLVVEFLAGGVVLGFVGQKTFEVRLIEIFDVLFVIKLGHCLGGGAINQFGP